MQNNYNKIKEFVESLLSTNRSYDFFVNWDNIKEVAKHSVELHAMNSLIRCDDFKNKFYELLDKIPQVITTFPLLFALSKNERLQLEKSNNELEINDFSTKTIEKFRFDPTKAKDGLSETDKARYYHFFIKIGLKELFDNIIEQNIVDYVIGVLVGLDTNGRKNRSGIAFESMCEKVIRPICEEYEITLFSQKQFSHLSNYDIIVNKYISNRKADFILIKNNIILNIETNFYFASGSKPEEIVDSYINRNQELKENNIEFILITDGNCWDNEDKVQLNKAFDNIKIMNYTMADNGYLKETIKEVF
ncbi:DpnII family type II restriction endonuclease, partial [Ureaplasma diversum]|uniref:DpnII family type II restriction endonuclease n=1 Tax=Ureaplasma diversum TaxID=42094 RepID=UPI00068FCF7D